MWVEYLRFELGWRLRQPLFWIATLMLFAMGLAFVSTDLGPMFAMGNKNVLRNAPLVLIHSQTAFTIFGMFIVVAFVSDSVMRDFRQQTAPFFFTMPNKEKHYLIGRFSGATIAGILPFLAPLFAFALAPYLPWQDPERIGPVRLAPMIYGFGLLALPNMLALAGLFFTIAILSRRLMVVYLLLVFLLLSQDVAEMLAAGLDNRLLGSVLEPFGLVALDEISRYWSLLENSTRQPDVSLGLVLNRLFWVGLGACAMVSGFLRFSTTAPFAAGKKEKDDGSRPPARLTRPTRVFDGAFQWRALLWQVRLETGMVVKSAPFVVLAATGAVFTLIFAGVIGKFQDAYSYPITSLMLDANGFVIRALMPILLIIYSGELVWKDHKSATQEHVLPVPDKIFLSSRLLALWTVIALTIAGGLLTTVVSQLIQGYTRLEPLLYLKGALVFFWPMAVMAAATLFLHSVANNKMTGHLLNLLLIVGNMVLPKLGLESLFLRYGSFPPITWSAFDGYGHMAAPFIQMGIYWTLVALVLCLLTTMVHVRSREAGWRARLKAVRAGLTPLRAGLLVSGILSCLTVALIIQRTTGAANLTVGEHKARLAAFERNYSQYAGLPVPRIKQVDVAMDLVPENRTATIKGCYVVENRDHHPIMQLPITIAPRFIEGLLPVEGGVELVSMGNLTAEIRDPEAGFYLFRLDQPLGPGAQTTLEFEVEVDQSAHRHRMVNFHITRNGSFFLNRNFMPVMGYTAENELMEPHDRKRFGLEPKQRMADIDDPHGHKINYLEGDWVNVNAVISTAPDQIAVAAGNLEREWQDNGRRYFHYQTKAPVTNLLGFMSGSYEVLRSKHQGIDLEIYYHPDHGVNVPKMMEAARQTLTYCIREFGPYPHDQLRIVEISGRNGGMAISLGGLIGFSESFGFHSKSDGIDAVSYVTAHEVAHQWWNHQVVPAAVQGACMIAESLSQYTSLAVLEQMYGSEAVARFLEYERDGYLRSRSRESREEMPLLLVENQDYIHYKKGSLAFNALSEVMGKAQLNRVLADFIADYRFSDEPFPHAGHLLERIRRVLPEEGHQVLEDMFETVTLHDFRIAESRLIRINENQYQLELVILSGAWRQDDTGQMISLPYEGPLEIGCYAGDNKDRFRVTITEPRQQVHLMLSHQPDHVVLDPRLTKLEQDRDDNRIELVPEPEQEIEITGRDDHAANQ